MSGNYNARRTRPLTANTYPEISRLGANAPHSGQSQWRSIRNRRTGLPQRVVRIGARQDRTFVLVVAGPSAVSASPGEFIVISGHARRRPRRPRNHYIGAGVIWRVSKTNRRPRRRAVRVFSKTAFVAR